LRNHHGFGVFAAHGSRNSATQRTPIVHFTSSPTRCGEYGGQVVYTTSIGSSRKERIIRRAGMMNPCRSSGSHISEHRKRFQGATLVGGAHGVIAFVPCSRRRRFTTARSELNAANTSRTLFIGVTCRSDTPAGTPARVACRPGGRGR